MTTAKTVRRKLEFEEGPKALANFKRTMTALFRVPKSEIAQVSKSRQVSKPRHKTTKAGT
jgi:hypothetical protein